MHDKTTTANAEKTLTIYNNDVKAQILTPFISGLFLKLNFEVLSLTLINKFRRSKTFERTVSAF